MMPPGAFASPSPAAIHAGSSWPGQASCHRIRIINRKPTSRKTSAVKPYCRPTVLWSVNRTRELYNRATYITQGERGERVPNTKWSDDGFLNSLRSQGDPQADAAIEQVVAEGQKESV